MNFMSRNPIFSGVGVRPCLLVPPPFARPPVVLSHNDFGRPWATRVGLPRLRNKAPRKSLGCYPVGWL